VASFRPLFKSIQAEPFVLLVYWVQIAAKFTKRAIMKKVFRDPDLKP
jgi:hypothetical protein